MRYVVSTNRYGREESYAFSTKTCAYRAMRKMYEDMSSFGLCEPVRDLGAYEVLHIWHVGFDTFYVGVMALDNVPDSTMSALDYVVSEHALTYMIACAITLIIAVAAEVCALFCNAEIVFFVAGIIIATFAAIMEIKFVKSCKKQDMM